MHIFRSESNAQNFQLIKEQSTTARWGSNIEDAGVQIVDQL